MHLHYNYLWRLWHQPSRNGKGRQIGLAVSFLNMAFTLRPHGSDYQMLGPCFVLTSIRDQFPDTQLCLEGDLKEFVSAELVKFGLTSDWAPLVGSYSPIQVHVR